VPFKGGHKRPFLGPTKIFINKTVLKILFFGEIFRFFAKVGGSAIRRKGRMDFSVHTFGMVFSGQTRCKNEVFL